jgi:SET domain
MACAFKNELDSPDFKNTIVRELRDSIQKHENLQIADRLYSAVRFGCSRAVVNLEGGINEGELDADLRRDDVYEFEAKVPEVTPRQMLRLTMRNGYGVARSWNHEITGVAVYYVPSLFNHSCMPNGYHVNIGDIMFVRGSTMIPADTEIFVPYTWFLNAESVQEEYGFGVKGRGFYVFLWDVSI